MLLDNFKKDFDTRKVMRLLGAKQGRRVSAGSLRRFDLLAEDIQKRLKPQLSFRVVGLKAINRSGLQLANGTRFKSPKLAKAMRGSQSICCFLATVGPGVDMEVKRLLRKRRYADAYTLDAMGSISAENVVEQFYRRMARRQAEKSGGVTLRFSPGYCDWPIQDQRPLFKLLDRTETPDVVLSDSCLMSPRKSVSGIFGLLPTGVEGVQPGYNPCNSCTKRNCIARRSN